MRLQIQALAHMVQDGVVPANFAGNALANTNHALAHFFRGEFLIERHRVQHIRWFQRQKLRDFNHGLIRDLSVRVLHLMQNGHERAMLGGVARQDFFFPRGLHLRRHIRFSASLYFFCR